jgi:hypothetical protein
MLKDIVEARHLGEHRLFLRFEDDAQGEFDLGRMLTFTGMLAPLVDPGYFAMVAVDPEAGTIVWPNGADLDPDMLYARITGVPVEERLAAADAS